MTANWTYIDGKQKTSGDIYGKLHLEPTIEKFANESLQNYIDRCLSNSTPSSLKYKFYYLKGKELKDFLVSVNWDSEFKSHWKNSQNPADPDLALNRQNAAKKMQEPKLLFCIIEDGGTEGLSGDEHGDGHYRRLIRDSLQTSGDGTKGGGHGYGKIVYFIHSIIKTAFFYSSVDNTKKDIFVGKSLISNRLHGGKLYDGEALFGDRIDEFEYKRLEGQYAQIKAKELGVVRKNIGSGTTILIPGFQAGDDYDTPEKIARKLKKVIEKNYWPHLIGKNKSSISIEYEDSRGSLQNIIPDPRSGPYSSFCDAAEENYGNCVPKIDKKNQTARRVYSEIEFPARTDTNKDPKSKYNPDIKLTITTKSNSLSEEKNTIALIRGHGKVVKYEPVSRSLNDDTPLFGVLQVGKAANNNNEAEWSDEYWRSLEPTGHDNWSDSELAKAKWMAPYYKPRQELFGRMRGEWLKDLIDSSIAPGEAVSSNLTKLFNFGGGNEKAKSITLSNESASFDPVAKVWKIEGTFEMSADNADPWEVELRVRPVTHDRTGKKLLDLDITNISDPHHINLSYKSGKQKAVFSIIPIPGQQILNLFQYNIEAFHRKDLPAIYRIETKFSKD